jgi:uncharacterized membrane protein YbhN (UPF0104 family)
MDLRARRRATALLPYVVALAFDAFAWRTLVTAVGVRGDSPGVTESPPFSALYRVRLRCDSFASTLPGGALVAESLAPVWLRDAMPIEAGAAAIAARKCVVGVAEGIYMLAGLAAGAGALAACGPAVPWIGAGAACAMLLLFGGTATALASGSVAARLHRVLASIPIASLRGALEPHAAAFERADTRLVALFRASPRHLVASCALAVVAWSIESVETWWLLHLAGLDLPFATVFAIESNVSLLRSVGSFAPGGLGVQDVGYVAVLQAIGAPDALNAGAAFLMMKRGKELVWAAVGYASLFFARRRAAVAPPSPVAERAPSRIAA